MRYKANTNLQSLRHHHFTKCSYAFPKKAPSAFKENPVTKRMVDLMLAHDISLAKEKVTEPAECGKTASELRFWCFGLVVWC